MLQTARPLTDQIYDTIVDEICNGTLKAETHLVQERLAERFGVSRQPIQQTMTRLKADGMVEELGKRGLFVTRLDPARMRQHYGIREALDAWAARTAATRVAEGEISADTLRREGDAIRQAGEAAAKRGDVADLVHQDSEFHFFVYAASGNPMLETTAEPHWRFLRRAMGDVLREPDAPRDIWAQHQGIVEAILAGDPDTAEARASAHVANAARMLEAALRQAAER